MDQLDKEKIIEFITPYYEMNDAAHQLDHALKVYDRAMEIADQLNTCHSETNRSSLQLAALLHDVTVHKGRSDHHITAVAFVEEHKHFLWSYSGGADMSIVKAAILSHRASKEPNPIGIVAMILACADKGEPKMNGEIWDRSYQYVVAQGKNHEEACVHAYDHIKEKYGPDGYVYTGNFLYQSLYAKQIEEQTQFVRDQSFLQIRKYLTNKFCKD